jgi:YjzC-like protein
MATNSNAGKTYYKTGETAPVKGTYRLARHIDSTTCSPTEIERQLLFAAGETIPPCKSCNTGAYWSLEKFG